MNLRRWGIVIRIMTILTKSMVNYAKSKLNYVHLCNSLFSPSFLFFLELVYVYPCEWNYRPDHCMYQNNCHTALSNGIFVIHGNRGVFHTSKYPTFQIIYDIIKEYQFGENIKTAIIERALNASKHTNDTYCKMMIKSFLKNMVEPTELDDT